MFLPNVFYRILDAEEDMREIDPLSLGFPSSASLADTLASFYVDRNRPYYPNGNVPLDMVAAKGYMTRILSGSQFKQILQNSSLVGLVDAFSYCALFAYGTKGLRRFDLCQLFLIRAQRILKAMVYNNLITSPPTVIKLLSILPWYLVPLIALGHNDMLREAISIQQYLVLPHKMSITATALSGVYGNISYLMRDLNLKARWLKAVEQLPSGSIPPYYDSYRVQLLACDVINNEDCMHPWDQLKGIPPAEPELSYRKVVLSHIENALAKLPVYPPYLFRDIEELKRGIQAGFDGAQAITLALLGRMQEAESHAIAVVTSHEPHEISWVNITLVFATVSALQVLIACKRSDMYVQAFALLNIFIPEVPRLIRIIHKCLEHLKELGTPFSEILKLQGTNELDFFTNWKFHDTDSVYGHFVTRATTLDPHALIILPLPEAQTTGTHPFGKSLDDAKAHASSPDTCSKSASQHHTSLLAHKQTTTDAVDAATALLNVSRAAGPQNGHPMKPNSSPSLPTNTQQNLPPGSGSSFLPSLFPTPARPVVPTAATQYFPYSTPNNPYGSVDFGMHSPLAALSAWQMMPQTFSNDESSFLGPFLRQPSLAEPSTPLSLLGQTKLHK